MSLDYRNIPIRPGRTITLSDAASEEFCHNAQQIARDGAERDRAYRLWRWVIDKVDYTPDRHDTIESILTDKGGNCADHAALLIAMFRAAGLQARLVREINIQPDSVRREESARSAKSVVFGRNHNDHTWVEVKIDGLWTPADSALQLFGLDEWIKERLEVGRLMEYGMIVPIIVVAYEGGGQGEGTPYNRTSYYLDEAAAQTLKEWTLLPAWEEWRREVAFFAARSTKVFELNVPFNVATEPTHLQNVARTIAALRSTT